MYVCQRLRSKMCVNVKAFRLFLMFSFILSISFIPGCFSQPAADQEQKTPSQEPLVVREQIGLVFEIEELAIDELLPETVGQEFATALQQKVSKQGYQIVTLISREESEAKGLDKVLLAEYSEEWLNGYRIICSFQGWTREVGLGPLFVIVGETRASISSTSGKKNAELELRQDAITSFWQTFPYQLPSPIFLDGSVKAEEKWWLQPEIASFYNFNDFEPPVVGNMLLMQTWGGGLDLIDVRTGGKVWEFKPASFVFNEQTVFVQTKDRLYVVNCLTGEIIESELAGVNCTDMEITGGELYVKYIERGAGHWYRLCRLDKTTGQKIWETSWKKPVDIKQNTASSIIVSMDGAYALDKETGEILWGPKPVSVYAASGERVLAREAIPENKQRVYALNARTGEEIWVREESYDWPYMQRVEVVGNTIYEFTSGGKGGGRSPPGMYWWPNIPASGDPVTDTIVAIDMNNGQKLWAKVYGDKDEGGRERDFQLGVQSGMLWEKDVYERTIVCRDYRTGGILWERIFEPPEDRITGIWSHQGYWADIEDKVLFVLLDDGELVALDSISGQELWRLDETDFREEGKSNGGQVLSFMGFDGSRVFAYVCLDEWRDITFHKYILYSLDARSGEVLWQVPIDYLSEYPNGVPQVEIAVIKEGFIFLLENYSGFNNVHVLDIYTGEEKWNIGLPMVLRIPHSGGEWGKYLLMNRTLYLWSADNDEEWDKNIFLAIDVDTGQLKWYYKTEVAIVDLLSVVDGNAFFWTRHETGEGIAYHLHCVTEKD